MRVVSLLPSATEICYALGVEPVGVSHDCDWPPDATERPVINRSFVDAGAASEEINEQVVRAEQDHGGVYEIDLDALERADPDLVVSQGICDVCAVDSVLVRDAIAEIGSDAEVLTTDPHSLADVFADVERVGEAVGHPDRAAEVVGNLRRRVEAVEKRAAGVEERPSVAVLDWLDPVMVAGHWIPGMVERAGGRYGMADRGARSRPREWTEVREYDPDVLVAAPCGFGVDRTTDHLNELTDRPGWADLTAVREDRAFVLDGHHYVNRPGPRLVDTLESLAGLLHPDRFESPAPEVARRIDGERVTGGPERDDQDSATNPT